MAIIPDTRRTLKAGGKEYSYFSLAAAEGRDFNVVALDLLGNGIARSMLLDYGDFAVDARLVQLQALPRPRC